MLASLSIGAVALGVGSGGLVASLVALLLSVGLTLLGVDDGAGIGLVVGILVGLASGGWVAGWRAVHSERFHGMITGLVLAFVVVIVARFGGSQASALVVVWQAVLAIAVSGTTGWLAGRRKASRR